MWFVIGLLVIVAFVSSAMRPKSISPKPTAFEDFNFPQFKEGTPQAVTFGDCWTDSWMVLGLGNFRTSEIKSKSGK